MNQKSPKQIKKFASEIAKGRSLQSSMLAAGYAPATAKRGKAALSKPMWESLMIESRKLELLGRKLSPERQKDLVRGRLAFNTLRGRDDGSQSAKILGSDKRVSMWQSESQSGLIVLQAPQIREIRHEVPILPPLEPGAEEEE